MNPLSSRSLVESCVLPIFICGTKSWSIGASLLSKLESIGKKILRLPKFTANQVPLLPLNWSTRCHCLCAKLSFLHEVHSSEQSTLSTGVFNALTFPSIESTLLINQCHLLEQAYSQKFTSEVLTNPDVVMRSLKEQIIKADCSLPLSEAKIHPCCRSCQPYGVAESLGYSSRSWPIWNYCCVINPQATKQESFCRDNVMWKIVTSLYT